MKSEKAREIIDREIDIACDDESYMTDEIYDISGLAFARVICHTCHNNNEDYADCDQFVCSECGIELQDWHRVERDEDDGDITYHEYTFKYCPNCGRKVEE